MENEISKDYEIKVPSQVEMQIIITDTHFKLPEKDLIDKLKKQNGVLKNSAMEITKIDRESYEYNRAICYQLTLD